MNYSALNREKYCSNDTASKTISSLTSVALIFIPINLSVFVTKVVLTHLELKFIERIASISQEPNFHTNFFFIKIPHLHFPSTITIQTFFIKIYILKKNRYQNRIILDIAHTHSYQTKDTDDLYDFAFGRIYCFNFAPGPPVTYVWVDVNRNRFFWPITHLIPDPQSATNLIISSSFRRQHKRSKYCVGCSRDRLFPYIICIIYTI